MDSSKRNYPAQPFPLPSHSAPAPCAQAESPHLPCNFCFGRGWAIRTLRFWRGAERLPIVVVIKAVLALDFAKGGSGFPPESWVAVVALISHTPDLGLVSQPWSARVPAPAPRSHIIPCGPESRHFSVINCDHPLVVSRFLTRCLTI
jgi:hypothetical protein